MPTSRLKSVVSNDGAAILDIENNSISTLNPTGAFVWKGLEREQSVEMIVAELAKETGASIDQVDCDVRAFVQQLREQKLSPH